MLTGAYFILTNINTHKYDQNAYRDVMIYFLTLMILVYIYNDQSIYKWRLLFKQILRFVKQILIDISVSDKAKETSETAKNNSKPKDLTLFEKIVGIVVLSIVATYCESSSLELQSKHQELEKKLAVDTKNEATVENEIKELESKIKNYQLVKKVLIALIVIAAASVLTEDVLPRLRKRYQLDARYKQAICLTLRGIGDQKDTIIFFTPLILLSVIIIIIAPEEHVYKAIIILTGTLFYCTGMCVLTVLTSWKNKQRQRLKKAAEKKRRDTIVRTCEKLFESKNTDHLIASLEKCNEHMQLFLLRKIRKEIHSENINNEDYVKEIEDHKQLGDLIDMLNNLDQIAELKNLLHQIGLATEDNELYKELICLEKKMQSVANAENVLNQWEKMVMRLETSKT